MTKTEHSNHTIVGCFNLCREVCSIVVRDQPKMVGLNESKKAIQIDESYFRGKRKYNKGRLRSGDEKQDDAETGNFVLILINSAY